MTGYSLAWTREGRQKKGNKKEKEEMLDKPRSRKPDGTGIALVSTS